MPLCCLQNSKEPHLVPRESQSPPTRPYIFWSDYISFSSLLVPSIQPRVLPCCDSNTLTRLLPQGLCTSCSILLEQSSQDLFVSMELSVPTESSSLKILFLTATLLSQWYCLSAFLDAIFLCGPFYPLYILASTPGLYVIVHLVYLSIK